MIWIRPRTTVMSQRHFDLTKRFVVNYVVSILIWRTDLLLPCCESTELKTLFVRYSPNDSGIVVQFWSTTWPRIRLQLRSIGGGPRPLIDFNAFRNYKQFIVIYCRNNRGVFSCIFRGVVAIDIELKNVDINQCATDNSLFANTHRCHQPSTKVRLHFPFINFSECFSNENPPECANKISDKFQDIF